MREFWQLVKLLAPYRPAMLAAALLSFATVGSNVGLMAVAAVLISRAALQPPVLDLMTLIVGVRFFGISRAVFRYLERYVSHDVTFRILGALRVDFYRRLEPLAPACLRSYRSGDLLSRLVAEVESLKDFYLRVLAPPLTALLVLGAMFVFLAGYGLRFALILLVFFILAGVVLPLSLKRLSRGVKEEMLKVRAEYNARLVDCIQGMTEIVVYGRTVSQMEEAARLGRKLAALQERMAWFSGLSQAGLQLAMHLCQWCILVAAVPLVQSGRLEGVFLAMLPLSAASGFEALQALPLMFSYWEESLAAWRRLRQVTQAALPAEEPQRAEESPQEGKILQVEDPLPAEEFQRAEESSRAGEISPVEESLPAEESPGPAKPCGYFLEITDLSFRYSPAEPWVLQGFNLSLPPGGRAALLGPSGAGKSTLVNILLRFDPYQAGSIRLGGRELKDYRPEEARRLFGVVSQHTHLFNATVRENLLLAKPQAGEAELWQAARNAQIHDFIQGLPQGYDTYIGEGGYKLSGGQRQRLAIARALLKDAPILVLDEATANLDAITEGTLLESLLPALEGRSLLVITHRPVISDRMDQVIRL